MHSETGKVTEYPTDGVYLEELGWTVYFAPRNEQNDIDHRSCVQHLDNTSRGISD